MATDKNQQEDNSYMFVDEDVEDISKRSKKSKGQFLDETITGEVKQDSKINLVADEDVSKEIVGTKSNAEVKEQLSFQERLEKRAEDLSQNLDDTLERRREDRREEEASSNIALNTERVNTQGRGFGIASLVCGVLSLTFFVSFINLFTSILSIAFGIIQIRRGTAKGISIAGILCSICSVVLMVICMNLLTSNQAFVDMLMSSFGNII